MLEIIAGIIPLMVIIGLVTIVYMMVSGSVFGRRSSSSNLNLVMAIVVMLIWIIMFPAFMEIIDFRFNNEPECIQEEWVDCELYNIPLDECEKDITEEGPYYDVRTITKFTKFTCTEWDDGSMLEPRSLDGQ